MSRENTLGKIIAWYSSGSLGTFIITDDEGEIEVDLGATLEQLSPVILTINKERNEYVTFIPLPHQYQVWIRQPQSKQYMVVLFHTIDFLRGFREACADMGFDFRLLLLGLPMMRVKDQIMYYTWRGYDLKQYSEGEEGDGVHNIVSPLAGEGFFYIEQPENHSQHLETLI